MAAPRLLPDNDVLVKLREQGWSYADIAEKYGVTTGAVYLRLRAKNAVKDRPAHRATLPWHVNRKHTFVHPALMLRYLGRRMAGETLEPVKERQLDRWVAEMTERNLVVRYNPECPPNPASPLHGGFWYVPRNDDDDPDSFVRFVPEDDIPRKA